MASLTFTTVSASTGVTGVVTTDVAVTFWVLVGSVVLWTFTVATFGSDDPAAGEYPGRVKSQLSEAPGAMS